MSALIATLLSRLDPVETTELLAFGWFFVLAALGMNVLSESPEAPHATQL